MPDVTFWRNRFNQFGPNSVTRGLSKGDNELEEHKAIFLKGIRRYIARLDGPILDFGCGVGRWTDDLPRPYLGLDLLPEHILLCRERYGEDESIRFGLSSELDNIPDRSFRSIFTLTVLQHIVEPSLRRHIVEQFS
jgi:SAM-dependent methyltransferase